MCGTYSPNHYPDSQTNLNCDIDLSSIPIKTVRVSVHVFQKDDGSENIPDNQNGIDFINYVVGHASGLMADMKVMDPSSPSPHIVDTKIRYVIVERHFWQDTDLWAKGDHKSTQHTEDLYDFVMSQSIPYKHNSIHLLLPGNYGMPAESGVACEIGCSDWSMLEDIYHFYGTNEYWKPGNVLRHEFGHNFMLWHAFMSQDYCDDTPSGNSCFSCSNYMMNNNAEQHAISEDQVGRMHYYLTKEPAILQGGITYGNLNISLSNSGNNGNASGSTINVGSSSGTVNVSAPSTSNFTWTLLGGSSGSFTQNSTGSTIYLSNLGSINLKVEWIENCQPFSRSLTFYNASYYYRIFPNPTSSYVQIEGDITKEISLLDPRGKVKTTTAKINKIELIDKDGNFVFSQKYIKSDNQRIDLSQFRNGTYYVNIYNDELIIKQKILKIN